MVDVYFGARDWAGGDVYRATLDLEIGALSEIEVAAEGDHSGFLAFHPDRSTLYVAGRLEGDPTVTAYRISEDGGLTLLNSQPIGDGLATHLAVHPSGGFLMTVQYGGGSVAVFPLESDGRVRARMQLIEHTEAFPELVSDGAEPHPHWSGFSPDGRFAFVPDLGLNQLVTYRVLEDGKGLQLSSAVASVEGGGPRHMRFSTDGRFIFLLNELTLSVTTFAYDAETGEAERLTTTPSLSDEEKSRVSFNSGSEILVHPNGRYVYSANRGHDSVTVYRNDEETGRLDVVEVEPIRGAWPRNINLDATGKWLLAAGADSNTVSIFSIDSETGELQFARGSVANVPGVICILPND